MAGTLMDAAQAARRDGPGTPALTFYDVATGERIELSWNTFDNWVSKVANLLSDELDIEPGGRISIELPAHWLGPAVLFGAWSAGLVLSDDPQSADVRVVGPGTTAYAGGSVCAVGAVLACSLRPLGGRFTEALPPGWLDFAVEVPPQPDALLVPSVTGREDEAVSATAWTGTHGELVAAAGPAAGPLGLVPGGRLATDVNPVAPAELVTALAAPFAIGASLVLVVNAGPDQRADILAQERVTCATWSD